MLAIVEDIMQLEIGKDLKLVAGKEGLSKPISWTYVCQENIISPWVQGREILILYGAGIQHDENSLVELVKECADKKLSCIIVLVGHFIQEVPKSMIKKANEVSIPIFEISYNIPITQMTRQIADLVMQRGSHTRLMGDLINDIIYGYEDNNQRLKNELTEAGYFWKRYNYMVVLSVKPKYLDKIRDISAHVCTALGTFISSFQSNKIIIIAGANTNGYSQRIIDISNTAIKEVFGKNSDGVCVAVGNHVGTASLLKKSYTNALHVLSTCESILHINSLSYSKMPVILKLLFESNNEDIVRRNYKSVLGNLLTYDKEHESNMIDTLRMYLKSNSNATETAKKLYIHRNTMNYRIKLISDLTSRDLTNPIDKFDLMCAIYIYDYYQSGKD